MVSLKTSQIFTHLDFKASIDVYTWNDGIYSEHEIGVSGGT